MNITIHINGKAYYLAIERWWHKTVVKQTRWWEINWRVYSGPTPYKTSFIWPPSAREFVRRLRNETKFQATLELHPRPTDRNETLPIIYNRKKTDELPPTP